jgi:hypothetical protein
LKIQRKHRIIFLAAFGLLICVFLLRIILMIIFRQNTFYTVVDKDLMISENNPVSAENTEIGYVSGLTPLKTDPGKELVTLSINRKINIPDKSFIEIDNSHPKDVATFEIKLVASSGFFQDKDTLPVREINIEPILTDTSVIVEKKQEPGTTKIIVTEKPIVRKKPEVNISVTFSVQILTSNVKLPDKSKKLKGIEGLNVYVEDGIYKYYVGKNLNFQESIRLCEEMKNKGFPDAFVIALQNEKRIPVKKALQLLKD